MNDDRGIVIQMILIFCLVVGSLFGIGYWLGHRTATDQHEELLLRADAAIGDAIMRIKECRQHSEEFARQTQHADQSQHERQGLQPAYQEAG